MIEARGLVKRFGAITAVDHVDLVAGATGIVGFLGPNGAGKTTTMRLLTGFLPMTEGHAVVAGFDVFEAPEQVKARVGYLPETPPLYPELTVGEYLRFVAELRGVARGAMPSRVGHAIERVGLRGLERRGIASLSKGFRQRVGLAQAIVHDPPVLILDEPTSGLDPAQVVGVRELVRQLATERLVVLSTHVLAEVDVLCERVVVVYRGKVAGDGTVASLGESIGRGPWLEVAFTGDGTTAEADLAGLPAVREVSRLGAGPIHRFKVRGEADAAARIAVLAVSKGWAIAALTPRAASLEVVFLALVGAEA